jgi:hypothetical protein
MEQGFQWHLFLAKDKSTLALAAALVCALFVLLAPWNRGNWPSSSATGTGVPTDAAMRN